MADTKLSALNELAATPASDDQIYVRDVSEAAADESKRITVANLMDAAVRSATLVVAANDSSTKSKVGADYVCDGTADEEEINAAMNALPARRGIVTLLEGTFTVAASILVPNGSIQIRGAGHGLSILHGSTRIVLANNANCIVLNGQSKKNCIYRDFLIDGNKANNSGGSIGLTSSGDNSIIEDVALYKCKTHGISLSGYNMFLKNVISTENDEYGFYLTGVAPRIRLIGCSSSLNSLRGFRVGTEEASLIGCNSGQDGYGFYIQGDYTMCIGCVVVLAEFSGFYLLGANRCTINGCVIESPSQRTDDTYAGIRLDGTSTHNIITHNHILGLETNKHDYCIEGDGTNDYNIIRDNILSDNQSSPAIKNPGANDEISNNIGYRTENSGTSSIDSGQTTKVVAHGLAVIPTIINIAFREQGDNDYGRWWISSIDSSNFTLNVSSNPGVSNLDFAWEAKVR